MLQVRGYAQKMPIIVNLDVMMAKRHMGVGEGVRIFENPVWIFKRRHGMWLI